MFLFKKEKKEAINVEPIGILDGGLEGICIFSELAKKYPFQQFIYINDLANYPYNGKDTEEIQELIKKHIDILCQYGVKEIICVSPYLLYLANDYFESLDIKIISLTNNLIEYVNNKFEHKNISFLARADVLKANVFQKDLKYNYLYNIPSDELENLIYNKQVKTAKSFETVRNVCKNAMNKQIDAFIYIDSILKVLDIEFKEYINAQEMVNLCDIAIMKNKDKINTKKIKINNIIISNINKDEFAKRTYFIDTKYNYIKDNTAIEKNIQAGEDNGSNQEAN